MTVVYRSLRVWGPRVPTSPLSSESSSAGALPPLWFLPVGFLSLCWSLTEAGGTQGLRVPSRPLTGFSGPQGRLWFRITVSQARVAIDLLEPLQAPAGDTQHVPPPWGSLPTACHPPMPEDLQVHAPALPWSAAQLGTAACGVNTPPGGSPLAPSPALPSALLWGLCSLWLVASLVAPGHPSAGTWLLPGHPVCATPAPAVLALSLSLLVGGRIIVTTG